MEESFDQVKGVVSTVSGYSGGHLKNPTYHDVVYKDTGHVEAIEITYDSKVVNLPDDHKLSFKKVRSWIKTNKAKLPLLKKAVRQKERGSIAKLAIVEGYISNMEGYLRHGIWLDLFYGEDQEHSTGWVKRHVARYDLSD